MMRFLGCSTLYWIVFTERWVPAWLRHAARHEIDADSCWCRTEGA